MFSEVLRDSNLENWSNFVGYMSACGQSITLTCQIKFSHSLHKVCTTCLGKELGPVPFVAMLMTCNKTLKNYPSLLFMFFL